MVLCFCHARDVLFVRFLIRLVVVVVVLFEDEVLGGLLGGGTRTAAVDYAVSGAGDLLVFVELGDLLV